MYRRRTVGTIAISFAVFAVACGSGGGRPTTSRAAPSRAVQIRIAERQHPRPHAMEDASLARAASEASLLPGLGRHHRAVTTTSREAQAFFDQGLRLLYAFNHDEAYRSFAKAATLDPSCGMCFWGATLSLGFNYNMPMLPARAQAAWDARQRALALAPRATPVERALIQAVATRQPGPDPFLVEAQRPQNQLYAEAMRGVAERFPEDLDVQTLYAESRMNLRPWALWTLDGEPAPGTIEIVDILEGVLVRDPDHVGANHYLIHAVEASPDPEQALPSADRLGDLAPGAGHLVHMPSHIYQRIGRYSAASQENRKAILADLAYAARARPTGYYIPMYLTHNYAFLAYATSFEGRAAESLAAAEGAQRTMPHAMAEAMPGADFYSAQPLLSLVRFGRWAEILGGPIPSSDTPVWRSLSRYARGVALARLGRADEAEAERVALDEARAGLAPEVKAGQNDATDMLAVAATSLEAHVAAARGEGAEAVQLFREAAWMEDDLAYDEPADWFVPVRHDLGALLLRESLPDEAEVVYREDLLRHPENGWSLFGLTQALAAQGADPAEVAATRERFHAAWRNADTVLSASAF